ncbi:HalOD1 output domain-containing protein [Haloferax namakaokahaiae]|uniref:HalOD1 output domain-containing protein n=1 Tax=Haloferax namakaokahaiae TaxID=1748331 RepID=A0ABD5ZJJ3_9EURY
MMARTESRIQSSIEYDSDTGTYRATLDDDDPIATSLVLCLARIKNITPTQLPPLARTIDPDALEAIFADAQNATLSFSYAGFDVTIDSTVTLELRPHGEHAPPEWN